MADAPVPSLAHAREAKINELSTYFTNDDLSIEELEHRIERVYQAASVAELEAITADLRSSVALPATASSRGAGTSVASSEAGSSRLLSLLSSTRRVGRWRVPPKLDIVAIMSDTKIDLTHAVVPPGGVDINLRVIMASFRLVVPPDMRVVNDTHAVLANVSSHADELPPNDASAAPMPVVRLTGFALMSDVNVVVRRREDPAYDD